MKPHRLIATALFISAFGPVYQAQATPIGGTVKEVVSRSAFTIQTAGVPASSSAFDLRQSSTPRKYAYATDSFWDELAQCETSQEWDNGGRFAGGLGIMNNSKFPKPAMGTWERFGGEEFAPTPNMATREEQIIVANRISVEGYRRLVKRDPDWARRQGVPAEYMWDQVPVGFGGWGCYKSKSTGKYRMNKPKMYYYDNFKDVVLFSFKFNEKSKAVHDLQVFLDIKIDNHYGAKTRAAHLKYLKKKNLSLEGVPKKARPESSAVSSSGVSKTSISGKVTKRCPEWEKLLKKYNLPIKDFSYIMWRESRCKAGVIGWNYESGMGHWNCKLAPANLYKKCKAVRSYDSGLLQINSSWVTVTEQVCGGRRGDMSVLLIPKCNIAVASYLYNDGGLNHWKATSGKKSS